MADIEVITLSQAVETIKTAILQSQARAARNVSAGSGAIETISERLQKELPGLQGFSERNIRNMRQFYETWSKLLIWQPAAAEMADQEKWQPSAAENQSPLATQLLLTPSRLDFSRDVFDVEMGKKA